MTTATTKTRKDITAGKKPAVTGVHYSYEKFLADLAIRIRQLRKERGLTLRDMVVTHGFHVSQWQAFERGKRGVALPSILRICDVFGLKIADLLGNAGEVNGPVDPSKVTKRRLK